MQPSPEPEPPFHDARGGGTVSEQRHDYQPERTGANVRPVLAVACLAALLALPGCLAPFRIHVDEDIVGATTGWVVTPSGVQGSFPGTRTLETRYAFDPSSSSPPFPGTLQVFSLRSVDRLSLTELLRHVKDLVADGAEENHIVLNETILEGHRTLRSGVDTQWFVRYGKTTEAGALFDDDVTVRILGEVGHDGRSNTSLVAVVYVQVARTRQCGPLLPTCTPTETSETTWLQLVGDPAGTVGGATSSTGFIDHLVTR